jgi:CRISPR-associated protein Csd1
MSPKSVRSRETFWQQIDQAAAESGDPALAAVSALGRSLAGDPALAARVAAEVEALKPAAGARCTFAWHPDESYTIVERDGVKNWWRAFYARFDQQRQEDGPRGVCQVTGDVGPVATRHPQLPMIPGGNSSGVYVVSNDKDAFLSYGLDAAANAAVGFRAAEGYTRALTALIQGRLPHCRLKVAADLCLFWTRQRTDDDFLSIFEAPNAELVAKLLRSADEGRQAVAADPNTFYCLTLSGNAARVIVRDYLEGPLAEIKGNLAGWFRDLSIVDAWGAEHVSTFPLWLLARATAFDTDAVAPALPAALLRAALKGLPLGDSVLAGCLKRLTAEGGEGFVAARLALIKLCLLRKGVAMTAELNVESASAPYLCGRLLAVFERLQWMALGDVNATVVDRYYGTASTAPALVLPRLFKSAQQHLSKLGSEKKGAAVNLQKDLEALCASIRSFPALLTLSQQGEFALGFYHQRADYRAGRGQRADVAEPAAAVVE